MIFHDIEQNTDEWLDLRIGKITGSSCSKMMANYGKAFGEPAKKAAVTIAIEQMTGKRSANEAYSNSQMQRGHDQEPIARILYENEYFTDIANGGFFDCDDFGCSPDGLVYEDGLIEIKSVLSNVHYANIKRGGIDPAYQWQIYFNLLKTDRQWIDFVSYCADFPDSSKLYVHRVKREDCQEKFDMIEQRSEQFFKLVDEIKETIIK
jgi:hypothetical protein